MTGRTLTPTGFEDDDGAADPHLVTALRAAEPATPDGEVALMALVARSRFLVPVVAVPTDAAADMAVVTLTAPDGQRALPVFSGVDALAAWDPAARPVPVPADRAAQAAVSEGCDVLVVDVGSPHATVLRPSMVWALAQRREWVPAYRDPFVEQSVARAVLGEPDIRGHALEAGAPATGALVVVLGLRPGLDAPDVQALASRVGERLATDGELRARVDDLVFRVTAAHSSGSPG
ncbi:MAG: SseB family protein [Dermatophilaceae bacterium]